MDTGWTDRNKEKLAYMIFNQLDGLFVLISFAPVSLFLFLHLPPAPRVGICVHMLVCVLRPKVRSGCFSLDAVHLVIAVLCFALCWQSALAHGAIGASKDVDSFSRPVQVLCVLRHYSSFNLC